MLGLDSRIEVTYLVAVLLGRDPRDHYSNNFAVGASVFSEGLYRYHSLLEDLQGRRRIIAEAEKDLETFECCSR